MPPEVPVIIGVGDIKNRTTNHKEPAVLIHEAILAAIQDASAADSASLQASIDSISVVKTWTWPYPDLPGLVASKLGVRPKHSFYSEHGGDKPGRLLDDAAKRIARGECKVAVIAGGEALASCWTPPSQSVQSVFTPTGMDLGSNLGGRHNFGTPIQVYPLYENAFRAHRNQSLAANHAESAALYASFAEIAARNEFAWSHGTAACDEETIKAIGGKNRMICFPYPLLMNAFNTVNLSSALLLTSLSHARSLSLSLPATHLVYPLASASTSDAPLFWHRPNFHSSPALSLSLSTALSLAGLSPSEIDLLDLYSCFPIVPKLAAAHLGLPLVGGGGAGVGGAGAGKKLSLLGGLTSFGGAGNNYSMHALTAMTRALRRGDGRTGLVLCNGGVLSYQCVVVLGREPTRGEAGYPVEEALPGEITDVEVPEMEERPEGEAVVETYTVEYKRDGTPLRGYIVGRLKGSGKRFLANHGDERTLRQMAESSEEIIGQEGWVEGDRKKDGRSLFSFGRLSKI